MSAQVVCVGESMITLLPEQPGPLEDAELFRRGFGGAESNAACALVALGVPAAWVSRVGADGFGRLLLDGIASHGVDVSGVDIDPHRPTGLYVKEIGAATGSPHDLGPGRSKLHYYRSTSAGSVLEPATLDQPRVAALLDSARLIHLTGITAALGQASGRDGGRQLVQAVLDQRRPGQLVSFDVNWRPAMWQRPEGSGGVDPADVLATLADQADVVFVGGDEAQALFGTDDPERLRALLPGPRLLVVKDAENGVSAFEGDTVVVEPALRVEVVEPIGAGDSFAAGYLAGLLRGYEQRRRLRLGHICAACALMVSGDHGTPPAADELTRLLECTAQEWSKLRAAAEVIA
ncbi:sugar kinase [Actinospica robiniae]|uniref:sugar kinase n=1 Tax=Actinospica robiniae TaxID=304901 RepID=UPI00040CFF02|nr:sugar kinase [Actinospica robiniae]